MDSRFRRTSQRVKKQALKFGPIDSCRVLSERDLDPDFLAHFGEFLSPSHKGFGYYCWKPQVISQSLGALAEGDILVYIDGGSHLNKRGTEKFKEYVDSCRQSPSGVLAFQTGWPEKNWSKGDLLDHFDVRNKPDVLESGQIQAGVILFRNCRSSREFVAQWLAVMKFDFRLIDDSPSSSPNLPGFRNHRHDQSIFSLTGKRLGITLMPASNQEAKRSGARTTSLEPFEHRRDIPGHQTRSARSRMRRFKELSNLFIVRSKRSLHALTFRTSQKLD